MQMTDLASREEWESIERFIHENYRLNARVYDDKGFTFTGHITWCNRLCPVVKARPSALSAICSPAQQNMSAEAKATGRPVVAECDLGLCKIVVPVLVNGQYIGAVGGCGQLLDEGEVDTFFAEKAAGLPESEVEALRSDLSRMSQFQADELAHILEEKIAVLVQRALSRIGLKGA